LADGVVMTGFPLFVSARSNASGADAYQQV
jgi:hypothetical protein